jgi:hypothetical protein
MCSLAWVSAWSQQYYYQLAWTIYILFAFNYSIVSATNPQPMAEQQLLRFIQNLYVSFGKRSNYAIIAPASGLFDHHLEYTLPRKLL